MNNPIASLRPNIYLAIIKSSRMSFMGRILSSLGLFVVFSGIFFLRADWRLIVFPGGLFLILVGIGLVWMGRSRKRTHMEQLLNEDDLLNRLELLSYISEKLNEQQMACLVDDGLSPRLVLLFTSEKLFVFPLSLDVSLFQAADKLVQDVKLYFNNDWKSPIVLEPVITWQELQIQMQLIEKESGKNRTNVFNSNILLNFAKEYGFMPLFSSTIVSTPEESPEQKDYKNNPIKKPNSSKMNVENSDIILETSKLKPTPVPNQDKNPPVKKLRPITRPNRGIGPVIFGLLFISVLFFVILQKEAIIDIAKIKIPIEYHDIIGLGKLIEYPDRSIKATTVKTSIISAELGGKRPIDSLNNGVEVNVLQRDTYQNELWYFINAHPRKDGWTKGNNLEFKVLLAEETPIYKQPNNNEEQGKSPDYPIPYVILKKYTTSQESWLYIRTITQLEGWIQEEGL